MEPNLNSPNLLDHYLNQWHLRNAQPLATTVTSHLYTVTTEATPNERVVLKLLTPYGHEERAGAIALDYWQGRGTVRMFRHDEQAQLMEYADGASLDPLVKAGKDDEATEIIARVLSELHATAGDPPEGLYPLRRWFRSLFQRAEAESSRHNESVYVRGARLAESLLTDPRDVRVLHGDIHHENIRHKAGRGWLAFDPKGLVGERTYDTANTLCNLVYRGNGNDNEARLLRSAEIFAERLKIDYARVLAFAFAYCCLSASWSAGEGNDPFEQNTQEIAAMIEPHLKG